MKTAAPMDKYVIDQYLAEGGMGAIYVGKKLGAGGFEKQVVLKQLLPEFTKQPEFIDLFLREARLSATLDHANITHTIDLVSTGKDHFIVMEFVEGDDLRSLFKKAKKRKNKISVGAGIFIAQETLSALAYAHQKRGQDGKPLGLIHRDISPSNILVSKNGEVKLTDFGIAKAATHNSVFYRVKGKVGYMSPEQAKSEALDPRSDLYSLAVCFYEMITGERLFVSQGITTSADELYSQPIPKISSKIKDAPADLDDIFFKALALEPSDRFQNAALFQEALLTCAHKNGLFMSSRSLAKHLDQVCYSDRDQFSDDSLDNHTGIFAEEDGTEQIDLNEISGVSSVDDFIMVGETMIRESDQKLSSHRNGLTQLGDFQGKELTSIIAPDISHLLDDGGTEPLDDFEEFESLSEIKDLKKKSDYDEKLRTVARMDSSDFSDEVKTIALSGEINLGEKKEVFEPRTVERLRSNKAKDASQSAPKRELAPYEDSDFTHDPTPLPSSPSLQIRDIDESPMPPTLLAKGKKSLKSPSSDINNNIGLSATVQAPQLDFGLPKKKANPQTPLAKAPPLSRAKDETPASFGDHTFGDFFDDSQSVVSDETPLPSKSPPANSSKPQIMVAEEDDYNHVLSIACLIFLTIATVVYVGFFTGPRLGL